MKCPRLLPFPRLSLHGSTLPFIHLLPRLRDVYASERNRVTEKSGRTINGEEIKKGDANGETKNPDGVENASAFRSDVLFCFFNNYRCLNAHLQFMPNPGSSSSHGHICVSARVTRSRSQATWNRASRALTLVLIGSLS